MSEPKPSSRLSGADEEDAVDATTREHLQRLYANVNLLGELGYDSTGETQYEDVKALEERIGRFRELLSECHPKLTSEGLKEDIAYLLGWVEDWRCECGDLNRHHEAFCYRCGAGQPEDDDE